MNTQGTEKKEHYKCCGIEFSGGDANSFETDSGHFHVKCPSSATEERQGDWKFWLNTQMTPLLASGIIHLDALPILERFIESLISHQEKTLRERAIACVPENILDSWSTAEVVSERDRRMFNIGRTVFREQMLAALSDME